MCLFSFESNELIKLNAYPDSSCIAFLAAYSSLGLLWQDFCFINKYSKSAYIANGTFNDFSP